ncbi:hypothetical protein [Streptomyces yangpuensis]|uniref:hypothetical protein n=1 Tax=Streptomyces yangpuensis TaxID=1648182 RepID=UPI00365FAC5A
MAFRHSDGDCAITAMYSVPDDAWYLELEHVAGQRHLVTAIVPDEDPAREPTVCFDPQAGHVDVPYAVMRWFMHQVDEEVRTSRAWMRLRPELVEIIHRLRQEYMGAIDDDDFPPRTGGAARHGRRGGPPRRSGGRLRTEPGSRVLIPPSLITSPCMARTPP